MREAQQDFPKITFAEQLREVEEAKEAAITRVEVHRRNHGAGHERECNINAHSRPSGPLKLQPRGAQQHRNGWHSHASDGDHHHHATTHEAVSRADQATCWRRTKNEPCSGQLHVKLLASSPKPERLAWNDMPLAASKHSSSPSDSRASASTLLVSSTSQVVAGACSLAGPPQAGAAGVLTATAGSSTSRNQAWHASVEAASKPQTLEQIQAQEEVCSSRVLDWAMHTPSRKNGHAHRWFRDWFTGIASLAHENSAASRDGISCGCRSRYSRPMWRRCSCSDRQIDKYSWAEPQQLGRAAKHRLEAKWYIAGHHATKGQHR